MACTRFRRAVVSMRVSTATVGAACVCSGRCARSCRRRAERDEEPGVRASPYTHTACSRPRSILFPPSAAVALVSSLHGQAVFCLGQFCVVCCAFVPLSPSRDEDVNAHARVAVECRERRYTATTRRACGQSLISTRTVMISTRTVNTRARARKRACICAACAHVRMHTIA